MQIIIGINCVILFEVLEKRANQQCKSPINTIQTYTDKFNIVEHVLSNINDYKIIKWLQIYKKNHKKIKNINKI